MRISNIDRLTPSEREQVYREVLAEHTAEDAAARIESENLDITSCRISQMSDEEKQEMANYVGYRWAFEGEYDCNLDYWSNIDNLIQSYLEQCVERDADNNKVVIFLTRPQIDKINCLLQTEPTSEEDCFPEGTTWVFTASFDDEIQMDIKICGVCYEDGKSNLPFTEAVLFDHNSQVCCTEPENYFLGVWELEYQGRTYSVEVKEDVHSATTQKCYSQGRPTVSVTHDNEIIRCSNTLQNKN